MYDTLMLLHHTDWIFFVLPALAGLVGTMSGALIPPLEGMALTYALWFLPGILTTTPLSVREVGSAVLLIWAASCLLMFIRFFCTSNWWIDWNQPSLVQHIQDVRDRLSKSKST